MYGLTHPVTRRPMRKDTGFLSNLTLTRSTMACSGRHDHTPIEGKNPANGLPVTSLTATYPRRLARALAHDIRQHIETGSSYVDHNRRALALHSAMITIFWSCLRCRFGARSGHEHTREPGKCKYATSPVHKVPQERVKLKGRSPLVTPEQLAKHTRLHWVLTVWLCLHLQQLHLAEWSCR